MNDSILAASCDLVRHIPDMARGFTISTNYGDLNITAEEAHAFIQLTQDVLQKRLVLLERAESSLDENPMNAGA